MKKPINDKSVEELESELSNIEQEIVVLRKEQKSLDAKFTSRISKREKINDHIAKLKLDEMNESGIVDWAYLLEYKSSSVHYREIESRLRSIGLYFGGGHSIETNQYCISIAMHIKEPNNVLNQKQMDSLKMILPFMKLPKSGEYYVDITENTHSRYGVWSMGVKEENGEWVGQVKQLTYGSSKNKSKWMTLDELIPVICELAPNDEQECDDEDYD